MSARAASEYFWRLVSGAGVYLLTRTGFCYRLDYMKDDSMAPTVSYGRRAASYWFVDGLPEILFGLALVIFAALAFLWRVYAPKPWSESDWMIVYAGLLLYLFLERGVLDFLKSRVTDPRTGYVRPHEQSRWIRLTLTTLS